MNRRVFFGVVIGGALLVCLGWQGALLNAPSDTLVGNGDFSGGQFHLQYFAPPSSQWAENGVSLYRAVLRVDTRAVEAWLNPPLGQPPAPNWQIGERHQYLVERRDGDGKRVINITLHTPSLAELPGHVILVAGLSVAILMLIMIRLPAGTANSPLAVMATGTLLGLGWWTFGLPFSYLALGWPFWGQIGIHMLANTLSVGALIHLALNYTPTLAWYQRRRTLILALIYGVYPLGILLIFLTQAGLTTALTWEFQAAILMKAASYPIWTIQYRRANVSQRGRMHWLLAGIVAYDLAYVVQGVSANDALWPVVQWLALLPPLGYALALLPGPTLRLALEPTYSLVQGIATTLTLALFLSGLGLAATLLTKSGQGESLPLVMIGLAVLFSLTTAPLASLIREQFDSWFGGTRGAQRALLYQFTQQIGNQIALDGILRAFHETLNQGVQCTHMALWLWSAESGTLYAVDAPAETPLVIPLDEPQQQALLRLENFSTTHRLWSEAREKALFHGLIPLAAQGKLVGVCAIGARVDGGNYSADTLRFFETLTRAATLAFQNAQLVQQLENSLMALRDAYQQLITAQEQERQNLAAELHDETLQRLAHMNLVVGSVRSLANGEQQAVIRDVQQHIMGTERSLREVLRGLHPAALTDLGLVPALESWLPRPAGIHIRLTVSGFDDRRLPNPRLELALYRLAQESVNNALKHARASQISLTLSWDVDQVLLEVVDDGVGFVPTPPSLNGHPRTRGAHFGLINLHERVRALNGTLMIKSQPKQGTTIKITLPVS